VIISKRKADPADETSWLRRLLAPPENARHERKDATERAEVVDEAEIVQQMYWVGILNTDSTFVPEVKCYALSKLALEQMHDEDHVPTAVIDALKPLVGSCWLTREEFENELDAKLPRETSYANRASVIQHAKKVQSMHLSKDSKLGWLLAKLLGFAVLCVALTWGAARLVDVNLFSLHGVYGNRLVRAYLGASHENRRPDPVTGFDPDDDLSLADLQASAGNGPYDGPYLLVNTALNLVHGDDLAWQERKAEPFVLAPHHCGCRTGYRKTADYAGGLSLGDAVTISGAAASPNMGYHSSPAVTVLLTVFNARLGAWLGNPAHPTAWRERGPPYGFLHLFKELFGLTDDSRYVYLSDGGHFENLGVYELVRRCRYIIASDADADPDHAFENMGNMIRKVRTDFGIRIDLALDVLRLQGEPRRCRLHYAVGEIHYEDVDDGATPGLLVYVKPSLTGDESADVLHYAESHPAFPHESTGNQFYSESQFDPEAQQIPAGIILVAWEDSSGPPAPWEYQFFVWMRGAYRNTGLGRSAGRAVLRQLRERWPGRFRLLARLPVANLAGPGGEIQKGMWLTFFYHQGFEQVGEQNGDMVLHREFLPGRSSRATAPSGITAPAAPSVGRSTAWAAGTHRFSNGQFFEELYRLLYPPPPDFTRSYLEANREYSAIQQAPRSLPALARLSAEIYPDGQQFASGMPPDAEALRAERHVVAQMLTVLEDAWFGLRLGQYRNHPVNDCRRAVCRRWLGSPAFRGHLRALVPEFSHDLLQFINRELVEIGQQPIQP
jgi:hypothetical protein